MQWLQGYRAWKHLGLLLLGTPATAPSWSFVDPQRWSHCTVRIQFGSAAHHQQCLTTGESTYPHIYNQILMQKTWNPFWKISFIFQRGLFWPGAGSQLQCLLGLVWLHLTACTRLCTISIICRLQCPKPLLPCMDRLGFTVFDDWSKPFCSTTLQVYHVAQSLHREKQM